MDSLLASFRRQNALLAELTPLLTGAEYRDIQLQLSDLQKFCVETLTSKRKESDKDKIAIAKKMSVVRR